MTAGSLPPATGSQFDMLYFHEFLKIGILYEYSALIKFRIVPGEDSLFKIYMKVTGYFYLKITVLK